MANANADDSPTAVGVDHSRRRALWPQWNPNKGSRHSTVDQRQAQPVSNSEAPSETVPDLNGNPDALIAKAPRPSRTEQEPSDEELVVHAQRVEKQATRDLNRLTRLLDLSEEQQDRIFPLLARSSTSYHPKLAIQVGRSESQQPSALPSDPTSTGDTEPSETSEPLLSNEADEQIHDLLTEDQQEALEDAIIDEDLWWTDIVADLEDELDESTLVVAPEPQPEEIEYSGNSGIGDLLKPQAEDQSGE